MKSSFALVPLCLSLSVSLASWPSQAATPAPGPSLNLDPASALQQLKEGNRRFVDGTANSCRDATFTRSKLENSQAPNTVILSCSDSRVPPEQVFDQELGQLFVVRVAGNVLNDDAIASMEYAVNQLGTRLIVVLGHESCGAVKSAIEIPPSADAGSPHLNHLLSEIRANLGAVTRKPSDPTLRKPVMKNVSSVASELLQRSRIIADAVASGKVRIEEGIYDLGSGMVDFWESSSGR